MKVLLANDDGITAAGLRALYAALQNQGHEVAAIAPMRQQSGVSHAITVFEPLRIERYAERNFRGTGVYGTPADCVKLGLGQLAPWQPDLVMAGINLGKNVGPDVFYSGTIGAAAEGAHAGLPSMAFSHALWNAQPEELAQAANHAVALAESVSWEHVRRGVVLNVNYPACGVAQANGIAVCPQAAAVWDNQYLENRDPRNLPYWWMNGEVDRESVAENTDMALLEQGWITLTPLKFEHTAEECLQALRHMKL